MPYIYSSVVVHNTHVQISRTHAVNCDDEDGPRGLYAFTEVHRSPSTSYTNAISKTTCVLWSSYWIRELIAINLVGLLYVTNVRPQPLVRVYVYRSWMKTPYHRQYIVLCACWSCFGWDDRRLFSYRRTLEIYSCDILKVYGAGHGTTTHILSNETFHKHANEWKIEIYFELISLSWSCLFGRWRKFD